MQTPNGISLDAELVHLDGVAVLMVRGEVDMATAPGLRSAIEHAMLLGAPVVVDLAGVTFMDSAGLRVLIVAHDQLASVRVRNPSAWVSRLLAMTALEELICT